MKDFWKNGKDFLTRKQSNILSAAFVISMTYGISMVLGIIRDRLIVSRFFSCCNLQLDAYYAAFRIPDTIFQLIVVGALSAAFIPVFSDCLTKDEKSAYRLASTLINLFLFFFILIAIIIFIFARPFSGLITGNFTQSQIDLMAQMTRIMLLAQVFFLISSFFSAMIQTNQRFLLPSLAPVAYNFGIIIVVFLFSPVLGIWSATFGVLLGAFLNLIIQLPLVFKLGFRYSLSINWRQPEVKKVLKLMFPRTLALAASQVESLVSLFLATSLSAGSLTIYYLAQRLGDLPVRLLGTSIGQAALPTLSLQQAKNEMEDFKRTLTNSFNQIVFLSLPAMTLFMVLRVQLVRFAYGAKSFPWLATIMTGRTLAAVAFSILTQSLIQLMVRGYYALHDTKTPFIVSLVSVATSILLSVFFIYQLNLGVFGLALAFSIANFVNFLLLFGLFNLKKFSFVEKSIYFKWIKMVISSVISGFVSWVLMKNLDERVFDTTKTIELLFLTLMCGFAGLCIYLLLSKLFGFEELQSIFKLGRKIGKWREALSPAKEIIEP